MNTHNELSTLRQVVGWLGWVGVSLGAGFIGSILSNVQTSQFYQQLARPAWAPPSWLFGPVWTTLYVMMGTAAWLVWRKAGWDGARFSLTLFLAHLVVNAAWTGIFFGLEMPGAAFAEIILLWVLIAVLIVRFMRVHAVAGALLVPYIAWVSYAAALNFALWRMNPGL